MLFEILWFFGIWLWATGLICLLIWLLVKRQAMLRSQDIWKQITFFSLGIGFGVTVVYGVAVAVYYLPGAEFREGFIFYFMASVLLPLVFLASTGAGLALTVTRYRDRLDTKVRSRTLSAAATMIFVSVVLAFVALNHSDIRSLLGF